MTFVHLGSPTHRPMHTVVARSRRELRSLVREARAAGEPVRVQRVGSDRIAKILGAKERTP